MLERLRAEAVASAPDELARREHREAILRALGEPSDGERELVLLVEWDALLPAVRNWVAADLVSRSRW